MSASSSRWEALEVEHWMRCVLGLLLLGLAACRGQTFAERSLLDYSGTISGQSHQTFHITGSQGEVLWVVLQQTGLDLELEIVDSQQTRLGRFESNTGRDGEDTAIVTLPRSGKYAVIVGTDQLPKLRATFKLTIKANGPLTAADRLYSSASNVASDAPPVDRIGELEDASTQFDKAGRWRDAGLAALAGATVTMNRVSDAQRWVRLSEQAVAAFEKTNEPKLLAAALTLLGAAQAAAPNADRSVIEKNFTRAIELYASVDSQVGGAEVRLYRGVARYGLIGNAAVDYPLILADWKTAADQCGAVHETLCEARAATNLGVYYRDERQTNLAVEYLYRAVSVAQDGSDPILFAGASDNLAFALQSIGEFDAAMYHHRRALQAFARDGECSGALRSLYGIGHSLLGVGDIEQATRFYQLARQASCRTGIAADAASVAKASATAALSIEQMCQASTPTAQRDRDELMIASWIAWDLGTLARSQGKPQTALACHDLALRLAPTVNSRFTARLEAVVDVLDAGDSNSARERFAALEPVAKEASSWYQPRTLDVSAQLQRAAGDLARAHETFRQAAAAYTASKQLEAQFETLGNLAEVKLLAGDPATAADYFAQADGALEQLRIGSADPIYRATLLASRRGLYENWLRGLADGAGTPADSRRSDMDSLIISERSRQRVLADLLNQYQVDQATQAARMQFAISEQNTELLNAWGTEPSPAESPDAFKKLEELRHSVGAVEAFDAAAQRKAADALRAWQASLPDRTCVVEFMLGEQASYAWLVRRNSLKRIDLGPAVTIRAAAANLRELLATDAAVATLRDASSRLHSLIVAPLGLPASDTQLTIVADDILNEIPFAALWDPQQDKYLIEMHALRYSPSLHFAATRALESRQPSLSRALLVGDAAYEADDAQARCGTRIESATPATDSQSLRRIRGSGREVEQIASLFLKAHSSTDALVGCAATRSNVLGKQLEDYRYIHFATHATADASLPLRSAIHLAAFDERGRRVQAELRARDLFARRLNAELVVLSGCSTASGRTFSGEGTLGLSFAMLAGGSRNVISALWPVADAASAQLVVKLYEQMIVERRPVAEALQSAQLSLLKDARWNRPRYWGPYLLIGS